jgi:ribonuclease HI
MLRVIIEADGGSRGNPGTAGYGAVVLNETATEVLALVGEAIGRDTNNVAEYRALIAGLYAALDLGATHALIRMDSKLVIEQAAGRWQVKHPGLQTLATDAKSLLKRFAGYELRWIPREENTRADHLANCAMSGRPLELPPGALSPVSVRRVAPKLESVSRPQSRTATDDTKQVELTASVAFDVVGEWMTELDAEAIAEMVLRNAPDRLSDIWDDDPPSAQWLAGRIRKRSMAWHRALARAGRQTRRSA